MSRSATMSRISIPPVNERRSAPGAAPVVAPRSTSSRGALPRRFLWLWTVAVMASSAAFLAHITLRFQTVRLGYEVGAARRAQRRLIEQRHVLTLEAATLRHAPRVDAIARGVLHMDIPTPDRIIAIDGRERARLAGSAR